jgi:SAM-dependent methyltransferase
MTINPYHSQNSLRSAEIVVPLVNTYVRPRSVLDVGCKHGEWLTVFSRNGAVRVLGYDRQKRADRGLLIAGADFRVADLNEPLALDDQFDLAVCLEVAEHLFPRAAAALVATLTSVAPVVLFSAATPGQGGHGHVNEQPRAHWHALFERHGFAPIDCLRPQLWQDPRVAFWYRKNILFYARVATLPALPALHAEARIERASDLELVHVDSLVKRGWRSGLHRFWRAAMGFA